MDTKRFLMLTPHSVPRLSKFRTCSASFKDQLNALHPLAFYIALGVTPFKFCFALRVYSGTAVAQWLRCCATNRKFAGSIPAGVIGIFH